MAVLLLLCSDHFVHLSVACAPAGMQVIQNHKRAVVVCDDDATLDLRVRTVRYFKVPCFSPRLY